MYHKSSGYKVFSFFNHLFLITLSLLCILPLLHVLAVSFSGKSAATANIVNLWPVDFTLESYQKTIDNPAFIRALFYSLYRTVLGTAIGMAVIVFAGYALSKRNAAFKSRNIYMWFFVFTMLFSGGLVLGLYSDYGSASHQYNLGARSAIGIKRIQYDSSDELLRTIPAELEEAALIDGAGLFRILFSIHLPVYHARAGNNYALHTSRSLEFLVRWFNLYDGHEEISTRYLPANCCRTAGFQQDEH